jgi:hypothetical protein
VTVTSALQATQSQAAEASGAALARDHWQSAAKAPGSPSKYPQTLEKRA